jgi:hypothetical protein
VLPHALARIDIIILGAALIPNVQQADYLSSKRKQLLANRIVYGLNLGK